MQTNNLIQLDEFGRIVIINPHLISQVSGAINTLDFQQPRREGFQRGQCLQARPPIVRLRLLITLRAKVMYDGNAVYATSTVFFKPARPV